ncbi:uncharacterized protein [Nicotiana sylvestris]|uniref:uncharacterized protein n=1 Tax=Nicotiana sylvestris TaxID=4096 RepID=UPI00388CAD0D
MILPTDAERVRRFIAGLHSCIRANMTREVAMGTSYQLVMEIARRIEGNHLRGREQLQLDKRARFFGEFNGAPSRGRGHFGRVQPSRPPYSASPPARGAPACPYFSAMAESSYCPPAIQGSSSGCQPSRGGVQTGRARPRGGGQTGRGQPATAQSGGGQPASAPAKFFALPARPDTLASDAVITCIISVCGRDASVLFDPGSTYSYVSSLFAHFLVIPPKTLGTHVHVPTLVGDSVVVDRVYRSCVVTFYGFETRADLMLLDMIDFEVILGMDWLSPYHAVLDCHTKTVTLTMPGLLGLECKGSTIDISSRVISFLKARHMVDKGCLAYLAYVWDTTAESPMINSIPVFWEFTDVFPSDLPGMPPDCNIEFCIDLAPGIQPISIPTYRMAPKDQEC